MINEVKFDPNEASLEPDGMIVLPPEVERELQEKGWVIYNGTYINTIWLDFSPEGK